jgi:hypothetical protein
VIPLSPARALLLLLPWAGLLCSLPVGAEEESVTARLEWRRAPGTKACLDGNSLERAVNRRWGRSVFVETTTPDIVLKGTVGRAEHGGWIVSLALYRGDGTSLGSRELVTAAPSCSSLDDSVALAVGLMLDVSRHRIVEERRASAAQGEKPADTGRTRSTAAPATAAKATETATLHEPVIEGPRISIPEDTQPSREPWRAAPSAGMEAAVGFLPSVAIAPRVGLSVDLPRFVPLELAASLFLEDREGASRGARFSAWSVEMAVCPFTLRKGAFRADSCVMERLGEVRATGFGFTEDAVVTELVSTVGAREAGTVSLVGPLSAFLGLSLEAPVVRYRFVFGDSIGNTRSVHRMAPLVGTGALGLSLEW